MFALSKIAGILLEPANLALLALIAAALMAGARKSRWARRGRRLGGVVTVLLVLAAVLPIEDWLLAPLENRFAQPLPLPERVDGIIVLGGAIDPVTSAARHEVSLGGAAERMTALVELGRRYPGAQLVFSGGSGSVLRPDAREAPFARALLDNLGFDSHRVAFEGQSRNTRENAELTRQMLAPEARQTWLLVTSATHMPRAMGAFRAVGWPVTAYPVDYGTGGEREWLRFNLGQGLGWLSAATHEWLGLVYYRLRGWSDSVFPAPSGV